MSGMIIVNYDTKSKIDPVLILNDECMIHIFSFVWGGRTKSKCDDIESSTSSPSGSPNDNTQSGGAEHNNKAITAGVSARALYAFHCRLSTLSVGWKWMLGRINNGQFASNLCVDLDDKVLEESGQRINFTVFLCQGKFSILSLSCSSPNRHDFLVASKLLQECDTTGLKKLSVALKLPLLENHESVSIQREFLDQVARRCPNLSSLNLALFLDKDSLVNQDVTQSLIFSHKLLSHLHVHLVCDTDSQVQFDDSVQSVFLFSNMTKFLPCLHTLSMESSGKIDEPSRPVFLIESPSLRVLKVDKLFDRQSLALTCPQLSEYHFKAKAVIGVPGDDPMLRLTQHTFVRYQGHAVGDGCIVYVNQESGLEGFVTRFAAPFNILL